MHFLYSVYVPPHSKAIPNHQISSDYTPDRIIVGLLPTSAFNGKIDMPAYVFEHHNVSSVYLTVGGKVIDGRAPFTS